MKIYSKPKQFLFYFKNCSFFSQYIESKDDLHTALLEALHYLVLISEVEEKEIFKISLEYWNCLASDLYREVNAKSCCIKFAF